jgi:hypothetical protein
MTIYIQKVWKEMKDEENNRFKNKKSVRLLLATSQLSMLPQN